MAGGGTKAVVAALLANTGIAVTKFAAWGLTQSASMLAEAIHSLADAGNQVLLLVGGKRAQREANELHQFGFGRERYVYSFIVAIVLFSVGGLFALYEGYHKVHDPHAIEHWKWVPVAVLVVAIIMESLSFRTAIIEANKLRGHVSWTRFVRNARAPELPVILLEDFAALTGLALALIGVALTLATGNGVFDGLGSMAIGALLVCVAIFLAIEMKSLLLGDKRARREATVLHQFGYGRERYVYSFIVAIVLFSVGGLFALYEGWHKVHEPHAIESWHWVPVAVLVADRKSVV